MKYFFIAVLVYSATLLAAPVVPAAAKNAYEAPDELLKKAEAGDADALYTVAVQYYLPKAREKEDGAEGDISTRYLSFYNEDALKKALGSLDQAASKGHIEACKILGGLYTEEQIKNYDKSIYYLGIAAEQGDETSMLTLADVYRAKRDYDNAIGWNMKYIEYTRFVARKCVTAFLHLSELYKIEKRTSTSNAKSYACLRIALLLGPAFNEKKFASDAEKLYKSMKPVEKQDAEAIIERWKRDKVFGDRESATPAPSDPSNIYGVPDDLFKKAESGDAAALFTVAADFYLPIASEGSERSRNGISIHNKDAFEKALVNFEKAANKGHIEACKMLSWIYLTEETVKNYDKAIYYINIPIKKGDFASTLALSEIYREKGDYDQAISLNMHLLEVYKNNKNCQKKIPDNQCVQFFMIRNGAFLNLSKLYKIENRASTSKAKSYACLQIYFLLLAPFKQKELANDAADLYKIMTPAEKQAAEAIIARWKRDQVFDGLESASLTPPTSAGSSAPSSSLPSPPGLPSSSAPPSEAELEQFWQQSPQFAQAEAELNNLFKEIMQRVFGDARREFIASQRQWLNTERNEYAGYLMKEQRYSKLQAYLAAIQERARHLALYAGQLRNPTTPVTLTGTFDNTFCTDTCRWKMIADDFLDPFDLGETSLIHEKYAQLEQQLNAAKASKAPVRFSGILQAATRFDLTSVKIVSGADSGQTAHGKALDSYNEGGPNNTVSVPGSEQTPSGNTLDTYKKDSSNPNL